MFYTDREVQCVCVCVLQVSQVVYIGKGLFLWLSLKWSVYSFNWSIWDFWSLMWREKTDVFWKTWNEKNLTRTVHTLKYVIFSTEEQFLCRTHPVLNIIG